MEDTESLPTVVVIRSILSENKDTCLAMENTGSLPMLVIIITDISENKDTCSDLLYYTREGTTNECHYKWGEIHF